MDYEARLEAFYARLPLQGTTVIDVGAHLGRHAIPLARQARVVHAFEPVPPIRHQLSERLMAQGLNNVAIYPFALSSANGFAQFQFIPNLPEESGLKARHIYNAKPDPAQPVQVQTLRLDDLMAPTLDVSFIKIDIEGGELDMLRGSKLLLTRWRPVVAFECGAASFLGYHETPELIYQVFAELGFDVHSIFGDRIVDAAEFREKTYLQTFWDYVAIPHEKSDLARQFD